MTGQGGQREDEMKKNARFLLQLILDTMQTLYNGLITASLSFGQQHLKGCRTLSIWILKATDPVHLTRS